MLLEDGCCRQRRLEAMRVAITHDAANASQSLAVLLVVVGKRVQPVLNGQRGSMSGDDVALRRGEAQRILAAEAARREALFQESVEAEKGRGDALARRFEEALRQANEEPVTKPTRDFDFD